MRKKKRKNLSFGISISLLECLSGKCTYTFGNYSPTKKIFPNFGHKVDSSNDQQTSNKRYLHLFIFIISLQLQKFFYLIKTIFSCNYPNKFCREKTKKKLGVDREM